MPCVMIIDDQPYMSFFIAKGLTDDGHSISCFKDAESAMENISPDSPDIVLLDIYSRGFENWDTLHSIKIKYPCLPVVIVTAYTNFLKDPRHAEADGYVIKEICTDKLKSKIRDLLACKGS